MIINRVQVDFFLLFPLVAYEAHTSPFQRYPLFSSFYNASKL